MDCLCFLVHCRVGFVRCFLEASDRLHVRSCFHHLVRNWHELTCRALAEELLVAVVKAAVKLTVACSVGLCSSLYPGNALNLSI